MMNKLFVALAVTLSLSASAQGPSKAPDPARAATGQWVLNLGSRTLMIVTLRPSDDPGKIVAGTMRNDHFTTENGHVFTHVQNDPETRLIVASAEKGNTLSMTLRASGDPSDVTNLLMKISDPNHASLQIVGYPTPPFLLTRAEGVAALAKDWDQGRIYTTDDTAESNAAMKRIFEEDQGVRNNLATFKDADVSKSDSKRRKATLMLLNENALHTGEDFARAAVVIQHGGTSQDYLLAHTLGVISLSKGDTDSLFIITTSLDRYLHSQNQPQIYGTHFQSVNRKPNTEEPFDKALIPDSLRLQLGVPTLEEQKEQGKTYDRELGIEQ